MQPIKIIDDEMDYVQHQETQSEIPAKLIHILTEKEKIATAKYFAEHTLPAIKKSQNFKAGAMGRQDHKIIL